MPNKSKQPQTIHPLFISYVPRPQSLVSTQQHVELLRMPSVCWSNGWRRPRMHFLLSRAAKLPGVQTMYGNQGFPHVSTTATSLWTGLTFQIFPFRWLLASLFHVWPTCKLGIKVDENPSFLSESCFRDPRPSLHNDYITFMIIYNASKYCPKPRISHELSDLAVTCVYIYIYINMYNYIYSI